MTFRDELVTSGTTLLLRALRAKQVTEARRAAHEFALGGEFEPLGNGLLCLLHEERSKTESAPLLGKAFVRELPVRITTAGFREEPNGDFIPPQTARDEETEARPKAGPCCFALAGVALALHVARLSP